MIDLFLAAPCSKSTKRVKPNGNINTELAKVLYFVWGKILFFTKVKFFLIIFFLETFFKLQE